MSGAGQRFWKKIQVRKFEATEKNDPGECELLYIFLVINFLHYEIFNGHHGYVASTSALLAGLH